MSSSLGQRLYEGLPVEGYRAQKEDAVDRVNEHRLLEERVLRAFDSMRGDDAFDQRWLALAYSYVEMAFMCANRAVFRPSRVELADEPRVPRRGVDEP